MSNVNHPRHYNTLGARCISCMRPIECIDVIEHMTLNAGNAVKYIWRKDEKGNLLEDLYKAKWYIEREIEREQKKMSDSERSEISTRHGLADPH